MSSKPVLFLLPGLMCDEAVWQHQRDTLSTVAEVIIPVFRGFTSLTDMAAHVLAQAPERFSVAGHSMGGRVAWELMAMAGKRIDRFAVLDSGVHPVRANEPGSRQLLMDKAKSEGLEAVADTWIPPMVHPGRHQDAPLMDAIRQMILRNSVDDFLGQMQALLNRKDQSTMLPDIEQDVLLIAGEADSHSPPEQHRAMAERLQHVRLEIVADAGHMVTMEKPQQVSTILHNWFGEQ